MSQTPSNPSFLSTFDTSHEMVYIRSTRSKPALGIRETPSFSACGIRTENILPITISPKPPWLFRSPIVHLNLHAHSKKHTNSLIYQTLYREYCTNHPTDIHLFTDGSKDELRVAAAACTPSTYFASSLPEGASIYTAELYGILFALRLIKKAHVDTATVFSDSLSALQAIQNFHIHHPLVLKIYLEYSKMLSQVTFCWLPGHMGIPGNERADRLAKAALSTPALVPLQIPGKDLKPLINTFLKHFWQ
ncbi:ribonuclease H family protein, partial [Solemya velum gill symbiont]|uniref:ribonuclease H family protein n=1 Tax=Solemya velum gill symbiont TaxID=2340 RepID=UPI0015C3031C